MRALIAAAALVASAGATRAAASEGPHVLFPWLCLERCGDNATAIAAQVQQLADNVDLFTGAAFELFNLGPNSTLILNNLTRVSAGLAASGLRQRHAMVSSYPYPPQFLTWMREVFATPGPFIAAAIAALKADASLTGFNVDWEPQGGGGPQPHAGDALAYAAFLDTFAKALHAAGDYQLSVAVATWSPIWNLTALGKTDVDLIASMGTYTGNFAVWKAQLADLLDAVPASKAVVGLETTNDVSARAAATAGGLPRRCTLAVSLECTHAHAGASGVVLCIARSRAARANKQAHRTCTCTHAPLPPPPPPPLPWRRAGR